MQSFFHYLHVDACLGVQASSDRVPPLLEGVAAFAASPKLALLLADRVAVESEDASLLGAHAAEAWAAQHHVGSRWETCHPYSKP